MKQFLTKTMMIPIVIFFFFLCSLFVDQPLSLLDGFIQIQIDKSILLTDYITVGGLGSALINSALLMLASFFIVKKCRIDITGPIFAGIFTIGGFAFFGKNILNVTIIYLGVYLYSKYKRIPLRQVIVIFLFSTGLAPISSLIMFGLDLSLHYSIPLGIMTGLLSGFILVELSSHVIVFHKGFDLYNVGFAGGILALLYYGLIRLCGLHYESVTVVSLESHTFLIGFILVLSLMYLVIGLILNHFTFNGYKTIIKKTGRDLADFTRNHSQPITFINIGLISLLLILFIFILGIQFNGPIIGAFMTVIGFGAFGKHIRNFFPSILGVLLIALVFDLDTKSMPIALAMIFSTGLAPIAGEHGVIPGLIAGIVHLPIALSFSELQGGILLYSNGFAAAFTGIIVHTMVTTFKRSDSYGTS